MAPKVEGKAGNVCLGNGEEPRKSRHPRTQPPGQAPRVFIAIEFSHHTDRSDSLSSFLHSFKSQVLGGSILPAERGLSVGDGAGLSHSNQGEELFTLISQPVRGRAPHIVRYSNKYDLSQVLNLLASF